MNPNYFVPSNRPPPPIPVSQMTNQYNPQTMMSGGQLNMRPTMPYPPPVGYPTSQYSYSNVSNPMMQFYQPPQQPQQQSQFYHPNPYYQQLMVNYPANYMQYYQNSFQMPPTTASSTQQAPQMVKPPSNDLAHPPPPPPPPTQQPDHPTSLPPQSSSNNSVPSANSQSIFTSAAAKAGVNEYGSFLNTFPTVLTSTTTTKSTNVTNFERSQTAIQQQEDNHQVNEQLNRGENLSNNSIAQNDQSFNQQTSLDNLLNTSLSTSLTASSATNSNTSTLNALTLNNMSTRSLANSSPQSHDQSAYSRTQSAKRQKLNISDFDENRIKSQLEQINHLKQLTTTPNNLMNKSQTLFTEADEGWLRMLNPEQKKTMDIIKEQQKNFEDIYNQWEDDYKEWRSKNVTLLDLETYQTNLKEWEDWRSSLLNRKIKLNQTCQEKVDDLKRQILGDEAVDRPQLTEDLVENHEKEERFDEKFDTLNEDFEDNSVDNYSERPEESESQFSNQKALFPSSKTIMQKDREEEERRLRIEDACKLFDYVNETKDVLNIIDRLDFKVQQDRINFNQQLESIKKTIESNSDSEDESARISFLDHSLNSSIDQPIHQIDQMSQKFDLNPILNKMKQIKSSAPTNEPLNKSLSNRFSSQLHDNQLENKQTSQQNELFKARPPVKIEEKPYSRIGGPIVKNEVKPYTRLKDQPKNSQPTSRPPSHQISSINNNELSDQSVNQPNAKQENNQPSIEIKPEKQYDSDFLSKLGIDLSTVNRVLSYKEIDYFLKPPSFTLNAEDLFELPAREYRPKQICLIVRGHPSSGKSDFIQLVCKSELKHRAMLPKIFNFKEYLIDQKRLSELYSTKEEFIKQCKKILFDDFSRLVKVNQFNLIIFNAINQQIIDFEHFYIIAKLHNYSTYIVEMDFLDYSDIPLGTTTTDMNFDEWSELSRNWELTPASYIKLKINNFIANSDGGSKMDRSANLLANRPINSPEIEEDDYVVDKSTFFSRIDLDDNLALDKLDDNRMKLKRPVDEYWSLPNDYYQRRYSRVKRVRWLDIELKK